MAIIKMVQGMTRELGRSQGYTPLPLRDEFIPSTEHPDLVVHVMVTAWELDPSELERLLAGGSIELRIIGATMPRDEATVRHSGWPPCLITVGLAPDINNG